MRNYESQQFLVLTFLGYDVSKQSRGQGGSRSGRQEPRQCERYLVVGAGAIMGQGEENNVSR